MRSDFSLNMVANPTRGQLPVNRENDDRTTASIAVDFSSCLKKNLNASRPSEHPPVRGESVKTFIGGIIGCNCC